jgi:hypothetical protein
MFCCMFSALLQAGNDVLEAQVQQLQQLLQAHEQLQSALQAHAAAPQQEAFTEMLATSLLETNMAAGK